MCVIIQILIIQSCFWQGKKGVVLHYHLEILTKLCYRLFIKTLKNHMNLWKMGKLVVCVVSVHHLGSSPCSSPLHTHRLCSGILQWRRWWGRLWGETWWPASGCRRSPHYCRSSSERKTGFRDKRPSCVKFACSPCMDFPTSQRHATNSRWIGDTNAVCVCVCVCARVSKWMDGWSFYCSFLLLSASS